MSVNWLFKLMALLVTLPLWMSSAIARDLVEVSTAFDGRIAYYVDRSSIASYGDAIVFLLVIQYRDAEKFDVGYVKTMEREYAALCQDQVVAPVSVKYLDSTGNVLFQGRKTSDAWTKLFKPLKPHEMVHKPAIDYVCRNRGQ